MKTGRTMMASAAAEALANIAEAQAKSERSRARLSSLWFCLICRAKALCGKEAFLLT